MEYHTLFREVDVVFSYDALSSTLIAIENNAKKYRVSTPHKL